MSADNWRTCPNCREACKATYAGIRLKVAIQADEATPTWREDYEWWMNDDGTVFGVYKGGCDRCGHRVRFDYVHEHA